MRFPMKPEDITLGTDHVWWHAKGTSVGFAEPKGTAMGISEERIQALKTEIKSEQERFLGVNREHTATAALLDAGQLKMNLNTISNCGRVCIRQPF